MASKSKKRRKVLGASCILAALIIAGSSFAWFTSKDEVINRLTANADYGVSIVESFAPPENWVPGQEVNKDVYAVNTGNTAAFVEETVSGKLTITTEVAKNAISANSVKLTAAERYAVEAGSYLAYKPGTSNKELGVQVVSMIPDATNLEGYTTANAATDFTPDAAGLYVFRRSIGVDPITKIETFKYEGYYFDGHDFYKVTDLKVVPDTVSYAGDNDKTDGNLASATFKYVEEESTTGVPTLKYDSVNNRLVATYNVGNSSTDLQPLAKAYDDALIAYQEALQEYQAALRGETSANNDIASKNQALQQAADVLRTANNTLQTAQNTLTNANNTLATATAEKNAAEAAVDDAKRTLYGYKDGGTTNEGDTQTEGTNSSGYYKTTSVYGKYKAAEAADDSAQNAVDSAMRGVYGYKDGGTTNEGDSQVDGSNSSGYYKTTSPYGEWKAAHDAVPTNVPDVTAAFQNAFDTYVDAKWTSTDPTEKATVTDAQGNKVSLTTVTYDQLRSYNLGLNTNSAEYNYYELVVTEKEKKEALDAAQATLDAALAAKAVTAQKKTDADNAVAAAQEDIDDANRDLYGYKDGGTTTEGDSQNEGTDSVGYYKTTSAYGRYKAAEAAKSAAQTNVDNAKIDLYGHANGSEAAISTTDPDGEADHYTSTSKYGDFKAKEKAYNDAVAAAGAADGPSATLNTARNNLAKVAQTKAEAEAAYESASNDANPAANEIKININLSDDVGILGTTADKWQLLPNPVNGGIAYFYYTSILGAGETSAQLIDSVELDSSVTDDMFKRFDFDLNVALKSAQIAYDADGNVTADATTELDANAKLPANATTDSAVNWTLK